MSKLLVMSWFWKQRESRATFLADHVNIWANMVRRNCTLDIDVACVTDLTDGLDPSIRIIEPPGFYDDLKTSRWRGGRPSCYRRIALFHPEAADIFGAERFVSMDLDCVIGGNIDAIWQRQEDFIICEASQKGNRWIYNGSMMMLTAGSRPRVFQKFTPEAAEKASARFVGSDQAWIAHCLGTGEATWGPDDGVVRWNGDRSGPLMFFPGHIKPWNAIAHPFVGAHYRLDPGRTGIILGEGKNVWNEVEQATGPFDQVIALPKAAQAWNGRVDHVAENIKHAKLMARMLGVENPVICGA